MEITSRIVAIVAALLLANPSPASAEPVYEVTPIVNGLNGAGIWGGAYHLNNSGQATGWITSHDDVWEAATYSQGIMTPSRPEGFSSGAAFGINDSGTVLTRLCQAGGMCVNATIAGGKVSELPGNLRYTDAWFGTSPINNGGQIAGSMRAGSGQHAFLYTPGVGAIDLGFGGVYSSGSAVNQAGAVAGWYQGADYLRHAVLYSDGVVQQLAPNARHSEANDINDGGVAVGRATSSAGEGYAVIFMDGKVIELGDRTVWGTGMATAINNAATVVGNADLMGYGWSPFVYRDGTMRDLNTLVGPGWTVGTAWDINDMGQILADAWNDDGTYQFIMLSPSNLSPVPELDQYLALIAGLFFVSAALRRRHPRVG